MRNSRRRRVGACLFATFIFFLTSGARAGIPTTQPAPIRAVLRVAVVVDDMDRSLDFFTRILDFKPQSDTEIAGEEYEKLYGVFGMRARVVALKLGEESIELIEYLTPRGRVIPRDSRSNDRWFQHIAIVTTDIDAAYKRLRENKVRHASTGPQRLPDWNAVAGGIKAFYFKDPDDHVLEAIWFPPGKGDPRWQGRRELFAGIDHTAIVVADTDRSLAFYRDQLGLRIVGASDNYGTEQAHLNNVAGAHLRITGLRAASGPGIEFLEYLSPRNGRAYPPDAQANDLFNWLTIMSAETAPQQGAVVRDPDGHALELVRPATP